MLNEVPSPCFVIEEKLIRANLKKLDFVQKQAGVKILLALKGFANFQLFPLIKEYLPGIAASSLAEALLGRDEFGGEIHSYSPAYNPEEFSAIAEISNHLTFNSLSQWKYYQESIKKLKRSPAIGLRINPEQSEVQVDLYNPSVPGSRLGVRADQLVELPEGIQGFHFHNLCEGRSDGLARTLQAVEEKFQRHLQKIRWINMGGGHLITHKDYDTNHLIQLLLGFKNRYPWIEIILEPGAAAVWQAGYLVTTVLDIINSSGINVALINASFAAHMPDCLEMPYRPIIRGASDPISGKPTYRIGGNTCLAGDFLSEYSFEKELRIGDKIIFEDMIHYTMVKTTLFNGVKHPTIALLKEDDSLIILKEYSYQDYRRHFG